MTTNSSKAVILNEVKNLRRASRGAKKRTMRWVAAPQSSLPGAPAVQAVALAPGEDVQWLWTHTPNGSYVSGYNIVRRLTPPAVILSKAKLAEAARRKAANLSRTGRPRKRQRPFAALRVTTEGAKRTTKS